MFCELGKGRIDIHPFLTKRKQEFVKDDYIIKTYNDTWLSGYNLHKEYYAALKRLKIRSKDIDMWVDAFYADKAGYQALEYETLEEHLESEIFSQQVRNKIRITLTKTAKKSVT
jgi:hypothetical protein